MVGNNGTNFQHNLLLTLWKVSSLCKVFRKKSMVNVKLSKTELSKIMQSGGFLGRFVGPLMKAALPLMKNALTLTSASAADAGIHEKILRLVTSALRTTTLH